jgi:hypothetical protein
MIVLGRGGGVVGEEWWGRRGGGGGVGGRRKGLAPIFEHPPFLLWQHL